MYQTDPFATDFEWMMRMVQQNPQQFFELLKSMEQQTPSGSTGTDWGKFMMNNMAKRDDFFGKGMQAYQTADYLKSPNFEKDIGSLWGGIKDVGTGIGTAASTVGGWMQSLLSLFGI